jgi:hypothetical protein
MSQPCPLCGCNDCERYDRSNWCATCVQVVLKEQDELDKPVQAPEIIG